VTTEVKTVRKLGKLQTDFTMCVAKLILKAAELGYELRLSECRRSNEQAEINAAGVDGRARIAELLFAEFPTLAKSILDNGRANGIRGSLHELGLAADFNLFKHGVYQTTTESHTVLGRYWETLDPLARWGGRFGDGNHYSFEFAGKR
jgi:hypothetical protein